MNPLLALHEQGQSLWLDFIVQSLITSGELARQVKEDGVRGVTSNPAIFEKAIAGTSEYAEAINMLKSEYPDAKGLYEQLAIRDIQGAADVLRPVYDETKRGDGYVSLEVSPLLARDTEGTMEEARRLFGAVGRKNVMIKVPATPEGIPAIEQLISEGININVTLLFAQETYEKVASAYIAGLEKRAAQGKPVDHVGSVASFFISRIDSAIDKILTEKQKSTDPDEQPVFQGLMGKVAIANGKLTYQRYLDIFGSPQWQALTDKGARTQRVLWASTSTKNPDYRDVLYVEELIGPDTVNTVPPATVDAFRDHGQVRTTLTKDVEAARTTMETLGKVGISMKDVTDQLLEEGVRLFAEPFEKLLTVVDKAR
jgi:transaldolase/glucose-6-phosphate isomerase